MKIADMKIARTKLSREMLAAAVAVAAIGIVLAQPAVMSMAGLDISKQRGFGGHDHDPVGTIIRERDVHGLSGVIKPLRMKD